MCPKTAKNVSNIHPKIASRTMLQAASILAPTWLDFGLVLAPKLKPNWHQVASKIYPKSKHKNDHALDRQLGPTWPQLGPNLAPTWPNLAQLGPNLAQLGPNLAPTWANLAQLGANWGPTWTNLAQLEANLVQLGPTWPQIGPTWPQLGTKMEPCWPLFGTFLGVLLASQLKIAFKTIFY